MVTRFFSLVLVIAIAILAQGTTSVTGSSLSMSCCEQIGVHQTCPKCPATTSGCTQCCVTLQPMAIFLVSDLMPHFSVTDARYSIHDDGGTMRSDQPLFTPPKEA